MFVHLSKHRRKRLFCLPAFSFFLLKLRYPWCMHIIRPKIEKEWTIFMTFNKVNTLIYKIFCAFPTFYTVIITPYPLRSCYRRVRIGAFISRKIFIKPIVLDRRGIVHITSTSHVPFTNVSGSISCILKSTCHRRKFVVQIITLLAPLITCLVVKESINSYFNREKSCC